MKVFLRFWLPIYSCACLEVSQHQWRRVLVIVSERNDSCTYCNFTPSEMFLPCCFCRNCQCQLCTYVCSTCSSVSRHLGISWKPGKMFNIFTLSNRLIKWWNFYVTVEVVISFHRWFWYHLEVARCSWMIAVDAYLTMNSVKNPCKCARA